MTEALSQGASDPVEADLVGLLRRASAADPAAADQLFALLYDELHRLAERHLRRGSAGLTLGATNSVLPARLPDRGQEAVYG